MQKTNVTKTLIKEFWYIPVVVLTTMIIFKTILFIGVIPSGSMKPTLDEGSFIVGTRFPKKISYGDIVVFKAPLEVAGEKRQYWIKRVIGTPGDEIRLEGDSVYRNGKELKEPYIRKKVKYETAVYNVPSGCVFLMGDNRNGSLDSRFWANPYLRKSEIVSRPVFTFPGSTKCKSKAKRLNDHKK